MEFRVDRGEGTSYFLHVKDNGLSKDYPFRLKSRLSIRDGMFFDGGEMPLSVKEFEETLDSFVDACPSQVIEAFKVEIERYARA